VNLFWKIFISLAASILIATFIFSYISLIKYNELKKLILKEKLNQIALTTKELIKEPFEKNQLSEVKKILFSINDKTDISLILVKDKHSIIVDKSNLSDDLVSLTKNFSLITSNIDKVKGISYTMIPLKLPDSFLIAAASKNITYLDQFEPFKNNVLFAIFLIIIAGIASHIISSRYNNSIKIIDNISEEISKGNFGYLANPKSDTGSISKLNRSMVKMGKLINEKFQILEKGRAQLETVLSAMSEGVMVVKSGGDVVLVNNALIDMFKIEDDITNKKYWELIRNKEISELIEKTISNKKPLSKEISFILPNQKFYLATTVPVDTPDTVVIVVMFDITDFKRLERIKADFIANVSHELRTPLTAIIGYTETLAEEDYDNQEDRKHFLGIIKKNTNRLIKIVSDLLVLSEIEGKDLFSIQSSKEDFEELGLREIIYSSLESLKSKTEEKNLKTSIEIPHGDSLKIKGNKFLLEQMLINLIDNAIKYTPEGGEIGIEAVKNDSKIKLNIHDTGIGIPKEHIDRVFERFYRVDKTRSRKIGGTGLGLSIVKHIVLMHGAEIDVKSELNKGSSFIITFTT